MLLKVELQGIYTDWIMAGLVNSVILVNLVQREGKG